MKKIISVLLAATVLSGLPAAAQDISIKASEPLRLPTGMYFGEVAGVATDSKGHIFVFQANGQPTVSLGGTRVFPHSSGAQLLEFDASGKYMGEIGHNLYGFVVPQSVRIDANDDIWAVDSYSDLVIKFSGKTQRVLWMLGRKPESVANPTQPPRPPRPGLLPGQGAPEDLFDLPTDVAFDSQGNIFVTDGLGSNTRVAKFNREGAFVKSFGSKGTDNSQFNHVTSVQVDSAGNVYVADPENHRIQVLDNDLDYKSTISGIDNPRTLCISGGAHPYLFVSDSNPIDDFDKGGAIYKMELSGNIVGKFGTAGKKSGDFGAVNEIDCRNANQLYTAESGNYRVQKVMLP